MNDKEKIDKLCEIIDKHRLKYILACKGEDCNPDNIINIVDALCSSRAVSFDILNRIVEQVRNEI